ncbi:MAG: preprotein translocase subunit YajC [Bifidobacterium subtile]|jgi:preprotein translocase subunit YajC|nr:preprotein translocase subunit YajC [Bifidobacterium subtile]MCI1241148.1 preprotein translocase subunit YajC [Bifidobacterium subtile]MCI1258337.1 preprotein translocase subunit YajC [Bifidobacterium subtile]
MQLILPIVLIVLMGGMMWWQSKKAKQQQAEVQNFRENLAPGTEVVTIGGVIGKVVSVDTKYEEIVIDSEGSLLRFKASAVNKTYTRPAFVDDDEVDENGNPLPQEDTGEAQAAYGEISDGAQDTPVQDDAYAQDAARPEASVEETAVDESSDEAAEGGVREVA